MKTALIALASYIASAAAVVVGYTPFLGVFDGHYWSMALRDLPVFRVSTINTVSAFAVLLVAFWASRGDKTTYKNALLGYAYMAPFLIVLVFLPGAQPAPDWAPLNFEWTIGLFFLIHLLVGLALRQKVWEVGGRSDA